MHTDIQQVTPSLNGVFHLINDSLLRTGTDKAGLLFEMNLHKFEVSTCSQDQLNAYRIIKKAAENDSDAAEYWLEDNFLELSRCFKDGWTVKQNLALASKYLHQAIKQMDEFNCRDIYDYIESNNDVQHDMKLILIDKFIEFNVFEYPLDIANVLSESDAKKSQKSGFDLYKKIAKKGSEEALIKMAECYDSGVGVKMNTAEAQRIFKILALKGNSDYAYLVGLRLATKLAKPTSAGDTALLWFKKAADDNHIDAALKAAEIMSAGNEKLKHGKEITRYYKLAAEAGITDAQYHYAKLSLHNNDYIAAYYFKESALNGNVDAAYELGMIYYEDEEYQDAFDWLSFAAERDHCNAQFEYGELLYFGYGCVENSKASEEWYLKAAQKGHVKATFSLGYCFAHHNTDPRLIKAAIPLFTKAAEQNYAYSMYELGCCYLNGLGVKQQLNVAKKWLTEAFKAGHSEAKKKLDETNDAVWDFYIANA